MQLSPDVADATATTEDLRALMEEPAGGLNHGRTASIDPEHLGAFLPLNTADAQEREFVLDGGWTIVHTKYGRAAGLSAHRGVTHPDEHVDDELRADVEHAFGFTADQMRSVYRQGRLSAEQVELRARIDARLLALSRGGANMTLLFRLLGFGGTEGTWPKALKNAMTRARAEVN